MMNEHTYNDTCCQQVTRPQDRSTHLFALPTPEAVAVAAGHLVAAFVLDCGHATYWAAFADLRNVLEVHGLVLEVEVAQPVIGIGPPTAPAKDTHALHRIAISISRKGRILLVYTEREIAISAYTEREIAMSIFRERNCHQYTKGERIVTSTNRERKSQKVAKSHRKSQEFPVESLRRFSLPAAHQRHLTPLQCSTAALLHSVWKLLKNSTIRQSCMLTQRFSSSSKLPGVCQAC